jgi:DNA repair protein RadC
MSQKNMFANTNDDLPLFSQTPMRVKVKPFNAQTASPTQTKLAVCPICLDTGEVNTGKHIAICNCAAGETLRLKRGPKSRALQRIERNTPNAYKQTGPTDDAVRLIRETADRSADVEILKHLIGDPILAMRLLDECGSIAGITRHSDPELLRVKGMTINRTSTIRAAMNFAHRSHVADERPAISAPADLLNLLGDMRTLEREEMRVISLNTKNRVLNIETVYRGSVHTVTIRVAELLADPIRRNASALIVAHNHPSSDPTPSPEDVAVTREIANACKLLDLDFLDHLVIGNPSFVSLKERGLGFR